MNRSFSYGIAAAIWAAMILWLSIAPGEQLPRMVWLPSPDKVGHFVVYAILSGLLGLSIYYSTKTKQSWGSWAVSLASGYGISMELIQYSFFPNRYFEVWDIVANIIGALVGWIILKKFIIHS